MKIELVDFSDVYFVHILKGRTPAVRVGKFVQVRSKEGEFIVLAPQGLAEHHANIVERFCELRGLAGEMNRDETHYEVCEPGWWVAGGGEWEIDEAKEELRLFGTSQAYGRFDSGPLDGLTLRSLRVIPGGTS